MDPTFGDAAPLEGMGCKLNSSYPVHCSQRQVLIDNSFVL